MNDSRFKVLFPWKKTSFKPLHFQRMFLTVSSPTFFFRSFRTSDSGSPPIFFCGPPEALESVCALLTAMGPTADRPEWPQKKALHLGGASELSERCRIVFGCKTKRGVRFFFGMKIGTSWWFHFFLMFTLTRGNDPIWRTFFSIGLKPPTSGCVSLGQSLATNTTSGDAWDMFLVSKYIQKQGVWKPRDKQ